MSKFCFSALLFAAVLLSTNQVQAQIISGQVTDSLSVPIDNAEVRLKVVNDTGNPEFAAITTTDASGNYSFNADIDPGNSVNYFSDPINLTEQVIIEVGAAGFQPARIIAGELGCHYFCFSGDFGGPRQGAITLNVGSDTTGLDVQLPTGSPLAGRVTAENGGAPIENVPVTVYVDAGDGRGFQPFNAASTTTDINGDWFSPIGLADGDYPIIAGNLPNSAVLNGTGFGNYVTVGYGGEKCQWGACVIGATTPVTVTSSVSLSDIDFALPDGAQLSGTLYDPAGVQLVDPAGQNRLLAILRLYTPDLGRQIASIGSVDGTYQIEGLSGGNYIVEYAPSMVFNQFIRVLNDGSHCPLGGCERTAAIPLAVPAGASRIHDMFFQEGWLFDVEITDAAGIPLTHEDQLQIDLINSGTGAIAGGGSNFGTSASPVSNVLSRHGVPAGDYIVATGTQFFGRSGVNGTNFIDAAAPGVTCLGASCADGPAITTYALAGAPSTINVSIPATPGFQISGTVTDTGGAPRSNMAVTFSNAAGEVLYHTFTASDGSYTSPGLPDGDYRVAVRDGGTSAPGFFPRDGVGFLGAQFGGGDCMGALECLDGGGGLVTIAGADQTNIDFSLSAGPTISGQIVDTLTGLPVLLELEVLDASGDLIDIYSTFSDGSFTTGGLRPGDYTIAAITTRAYGLVSSGTSVKGIAPSSSQTVTVGTDDVVLNTPLVVTESLIYRDAFRR
jgi:hypothetical protein